MKTVIKKIAFLAICSAFFFIGCEKDNASDPIYSKSQEISPIVQETENASKASSSSSSQPTIYTYSSNSSSVSKGDTNAESLFCCDVQWVGFTSLPFPPYSDGFTFNFNRYDANASDYRHRFTIFRNDVLYWTGTFSNEEDSECNSFTTSLVWPNGIGNCCGVFSATMAQEYRIGNTWYTCDADHGEFDYFPAGCGWCE